MGKLLLHFVELEDFFGMLATQKNFKIIDNNLSYLNSLEDSCQYVLQTEIRVFGARKEKS